MVDVKKVKVRLRPPMGYLCVTTPSTSIILHSGETVEVDVDTYNKKLKEFADIVPEKEKKEKSEKKTVSFLFKDEEK
jgi:hypothetical protein